MSNKGDVLGCAKAAIAKLYNDMPVDAETGEPLITIGHATVTGYGEALLLEALRVDSGEIETVAHLRGAQQMLPGVEFILDIGGQDMKCLRVKDGVIDHIMLNEACSSGCGSFIESFATGLNLDVSEFAKTAIHAEHPVDLGSRCTVFMNSRVKQAQKEGATVGDIAAGLAISVIKNALFKVIKIRDPHDVGTKVIVQGGTFLNDAVLRAFEQLAGVHAVRPDIAGNMGAYGAALLARDRYRKQVAALESKHGQVEAAGERSEGREASERSSSAASAAPQVESGSADAEVVAPQIKSTLLSLERIESLAPHAQDRALQGLLERLPAHGERFRQGREHWQTPPLHHGQPLREGRRRARQEVAAGAEPLRVQEQAPVRPLHAACSRQGHARHGGHPRALNMYENYPFWFTFFTKLGWRVVLSDPSTKKTYEAGIESMPSESVCYPAKLSHGHIMNLLDKHPDFIWFPCSKWERQEDDTAGNHFNCPIVASYAEALRLNIDELRESSTQFLNPWLPYDKKEHLKKRLMVELIEAHPESHGRRCFRPDAGGSGRCGRSCLGRRRGVQARHAREGHRDPEMDGGDRHPRHRAGGPPLP